MILYTLFENILWGWP